MNHIDKFSELTAKYLAGETNPTEERELFAWTGADPANQKFFEELVETWNLTEGASTSPFEADIHTAWANIDAALDGKTAPSQPPKHPSNQTIKQSNTPSPKIIPLSKMVWRWSVAAAILMLAGIGLWWLRQQPDQPLLVEVRTFDKEKKEILLPDSSHVWLNENSKLVYRQKFDQRQVTLEGEAFFDVKRLEERPFEILSGEAKTTVLGTSFNVRAYPAEDKIEVTVESGKVALGVTKQQHPSVILKAGESGIFDKKAEKAVLATEKIANADAWKTARLDFDEARVEDVIHALERYFDVRIEVSDPMILECHLSANFSEPTLPEAMEVISFGLGLDWKETDGKFILSGTGCQPDN